MDVRSGKFVIVAHSFGSLVAVEMVRMLEEKGCQGEVISIDGSPEYMKIMLKSHLQDDSEDILQTAMLYFLMRRYMTEEMINKHKVCFTNLFGLIFFSYMVEMYLHKHNIQIVCRNVQNSK